MSLRKQVRSKKYMDETFERLELGVRPRYGRLEFAELGEVIGKKYVGGISTQAAIDAAESGPEPVIAAGYLFEIGGDVNPDKYITYLENTTFDLTDFDINDTTTASLIKINGNTLESGYYYLIDTTELFGHPIRFIIFEDTVSAFGFTEYATFELFNGCATTLGSLCEEETIASFYVNITGSPYVLLDENLITVSDGVYLLGDSSIYGNNGYYTVIGGYSIDRVEFND